MSVSRDFITRYSISRIGLPGRIGSARIGNIPARHDTILHGREFFLTCREKAANSRWHWPTQ
jgi:hypothetical protein